MRHPFIRFKGLHLFLAVLMTMAAVLATAAPVMAQGENGVYTVNINRYFLDPQTGLSGWGNSENEAIGQGMVESAVGSTALLEVMDGHYYLTVRIILAGSVSNVSFGVRQAGGSDYAGVTAYCTQDNTSSSNTIDYCFEIPDTSCTVAGFMYVDKMGTDVVFFATLSGNLQAGSGDFAVTNYSEPAAQAAAPAEAAPAPAAAAAAEPTAAAAAEAVTAETEAVAETETATEAEIVTDEETTEAAAATTEAETEETTEEETEEETEKSGGNTGLIIGIVAVVVIAAAAAVVLIRRKRG